MFFSVVIPVYNRAEAIRTTLKSVQTQTLEDFECIVVDDGSKDVDELRKVIAGLGDHRFILIEQSNRGGGAARNAGIQAAKGEWIAFLDSDDAFLPNKLLAIQRAIKANGSFDVYAHYAKVIRDRSTAFTRPTRPLRAGEDVASFMFREREFMQTSTLVVSARVAKLVLFDPILRKAQDVDFVIRLQRSGFSFFFVEETLSIWNDQPADGRVGAPKKPEAIQAWYNAQREHLSPVLRRAFEGSYLAYEISDRYPVTATFFILRAFLSGSIGGRLTILSLMRVHLPPEAYRRVLNFALRRRAQ